MRTTATFLALAAVWLARGMDQPADAGRSPEVAQAQPAAEKQRPPRPAEFAVVFSFGYGSDLMPREDDRFGELLAKVKAAGFNTIHCTYTPARLELCRKHGVQMMVDLLAPEHHVYKDPDKARAVCEKLRKHPAVWGYNLWNDPIGKSAAGRRRDVEAVRRWDPTHPSFCGTYRTGGLKNPIPADVLAYYDFHWHRGTDQHFPHLLRYAGWARERQACFYRWLEVDAGRPGAGNVNRCLYSVNTSLACGLKGCLWFLGTRLMDAKTLQWTPLGQDLGKVNRQIAPLRREVAKLEGPTAVYSTPITRTLKDQELPGGMKARMPPGLEGREFPKEFVLQPVAGEFVLGVFKSDGGEAFFLANHNAYRPQAVKLKVAEGRRVSLFDRGEGRWRVLQARDAVVDVPLTAGAGELLRLER